MDSFLYFITWMIVGYIIVYAACLIGDVVVELLDVLEILVKTVYRMAVGVLKHCYFCVRGILFHTKRGRKSD